MSEQTDFEDRKVLAHLLNSGQKPSEAAQELGRSRAWAYKWQSRYAQEAWMGLQSHSRAPKHVPSRTSAEVRQGILRLRRRSTWATLAQMRFMAGCGPRASHPGQLSAPSSACYAKRARPSPAYPKLKRQWCIRT